MLNLYKSLPDLITEIKKTVYSVAPAGSNMPSWKAYDGEQLDAIGGRDRLFDVYVDEDSEPELVTAFGDGTQDLDVNLYIDVCYVKDKYHTSVAIADFQAIKTALNKRSFASIDGFNFMRVGNFNLSEGETENYKFLKILLIARLTARS